MTDRIEANPNIHPFQFVVSEDNLRNIMLRVADFPWHEMPDDGGWDYGTNLDYLKELCAYWVDDFDWPHKRLELILLQILRQWLMELICISSMKEEVVKTQRLF